MPFWRFLIFSFAGAFLWCIPLTAVGYYWGPRWEEFRNSIRWLDYPFAGFILLLVALYIWHKVRELRAQERRRVLSD